MSELEIRPLHKETLGEFLRMRRESLGLSLHDIAAELQTSQRFVSALETGLYHEFTAKIYAKGFLARFVSILGFREEIPEIMFRFEEEWNRFSPSQIKRNSFLPRQAIRKSLYVTPYRIRFWAISISLFLFFSFLGIRLFDFIRPPALLIKEPIALELRVHDPVMSVSGKGEKESRLTVNGRELKIDTLGNFEDTIDLHAGLNILEFTLENRFKKVARVTKYILVE